MTASDSPLRTDPLEAPEPRPSGAASRAPVPKRKRPVTYRVVPRSRRHGLLILNTGDGKGKTTAALGILLRAHGRGMKVGMFQFVKAITDGGEHRAAERLGLSIASIGAGCTLGRLVTSQDIANAQSGWARCEESLRQGEYDVLVLDELTLPLAWGWLDVSRVVSALVARAPGTHVIVTGREAPQPLVDVADLITEMRALKHSLHTRGPHPQAGIDI
jgi:cob(I)alamin adenosyltransferase